MKISARIQIHDPEKTIYKEVFEAETDHPTEYVKSILNRFNASLKKGEHPRSIIGRARILDKTNRRKHVWEKTNLVTIEKSGSMYDTCRCSNCGITGKRSTLGGSPVIDKKYKKADPVYCK